MTELAPDKDKNFKVVERKILFAKKEKM